MYFAFNICLYSIHRFWLNEFVIWPINVQVGIMDEPSFLYINIFSFLVMNAIFQVPRRLMELLLWRHVAEWKMFYLSRAWINGCSRQILWSYVEVRAYELWKECGLDWSWPNDHFDIVQLMKMQSSCVWCQQGCLNDNRSDRAIVVTLSLWAVPIPYCVYRIFWKKSTSAFWCSTYAIALHSVVNKIYSFTSAAVRSNFICI